MSNVQKTIYAQADPETGGRIVWGLGENLPIARGDIQTIDFPKNKSYDVTIELIDNTALGLQFHSTDPLWAKDGSGCPKTSGINTNDIPKGSVGFPKKSGGGDDYARLLFINNNQKKGLIGYQLNFVESDGTTPASPQLDPEFRNGGSGGGGIASSAAVAITGAVVGGLLTIVSMPSATPATIAGVALGAALVALALYFGAQGLRERTA
jgi:hypothetical protein